MLRNIQGPEREAVRQPREANEFLATLGGPGLQQSLLDEPPSFPPRKGPRTWPSRPWRPKRKHWPSKLVKRALALHPDRVDALMLLTLLHATSPKAAIEGMQRAVAAGERALGAQFFAEIRGTSGASWRRDPTCVPA